MSSNSKTLSNVRSRVSMVTSELCTQSSHNLKFMIFSNVGFWLYRGGMFEPSWCKKLKRVEVCWWRISCQHHISAYVLYARSRSFKRAKHLRMVRYLFHLQFVTALSFKLATSCQENCRRFLNDEGWVAAQLCANARSRRQHQHEVGIRTFHR